MFRITISKCIHQGKELDCYVPERFERGNWISLLSKGCYILKDSFNPLIVCKKCAGSGKNCYLNSKLDLVIENNKPCKECNGIGLRKGVSVDNKYIADWYVKKAEKELDLYNDLKLKYERTGS